MQNLFVRKFFLFICKCCLAGSKYFWGPGASIIFKIREEYSMSRGLVFCLICTALTASLPAITYSQLALGGGYRCILLVSNRGNVPWEGLVNIRKANDEIWNTQWSLDGIDQTGNSGFAISLPPHGTAKYILSSIDAVPRAGYLEIVGGGMHSTDDISTSFFYNLYLEDRLVDSVGSSPARLNKRFILPVETGPGLNTGVAWAPFLKSEQFPIQAAIYDDEGNLVDETELTFSGHQAQFATEIVDGLPYKLMGSLVLESAQESY